MDKSNGQATFQYPMTDAQRDKLRALTGGSQAHLVEELVKDVPEAEKPYHGLFPPEANANPYRNQEALKPDPGLKWDKKKLRMDLIPVEALERLAEVLTYGANKYTDRNWEKGISWSRTYGAALRHLTAWFKGEDLDPESGLPHLGHAICNLAFLLEFAKTKKEFDDRNRL